MLMALLCGLQSCGGCSNCLRAKTFCKSKLVQLFSEVGHGGCVGGCWFLDLLELCYSVDFELTFCPAPLFNIFIVQFKVYKIQFKSSEEFDRLSFKKFWPVMPGVFLGRPG